MNGAKAARRIRDVGPAGDLDDRTADALELLLGPGEIVDLGDRPGTDDYLCASLEDRRNQSGNRSGVVLVVRIGIDDDVRAGLEARLDARHEGARQTLVMRQGDDVIHSTSARNLIRPIPAAIVDDQPFDTVETRHTTRQRRQGLR